MRKRRTNIIDLTGQRFGRLAVMGLAPHETKGTYWDCLCDCGKQSRVRSGHLRNGHAQSCGCLAIERSSERERSHGLTKTREYTIWAMMKQRCLNPNAVGYERYGGMGIRICDRWMTFENFVADMGIAPSADHSLDRVDSEGDYEPANCKWATCKEQNRNRRWNNRLITLNGETKCLAEWCEIYSQPYSRIWHRLSKGATPETAFVE